MTLFRAELVETHSRLIQLSANGIIFSMFSIADLQECWHYGEFHRIPLHFNPYLGEFFTLAVSKKILAFDLHRVDVCYTA